MRRRHILLIMVLTIAVWLACWHLSPNRELTLLVVNKTVPEAGFREHRSIFWIAEHRRFFSPTGDIYRVDEDYLGFHPATERKELLTESSLGDSDYLYLVDSYGIYDYEKDFLAYEENLPYAHQGIELLYGGLSAREIEVVATFAEKPQAVLIGEHNIFGYPTYLDPEAALALQHIFAVKYSGWLLRYYSDLNQAAFWLKELYSRIYGRQWDLRGPGLVFVRENVPSLGLIEDLVIITADQFNAPWPVIRNSEHQLLSGASQSVPYLYWVEVLEADPRASVLSHIELPLKAEARDALRKRGLPEIIPTMIYYAPPGQAQRIYFAGDFADQLPALLPSQLCGSAAIQKLITFLPGIPVEYRFYFQWYEPVLHNIFTLERAYLDD